MAVYACAGRPNCHMGTLELLSWQKGGGVLVRVASHPNTPSRVLERLARHEFQQVRALAQLQLRARASGAA